jgi:ATP-dependent exoDNAse (exonuclease V) alpha subunit
MAIYHLSVKVIGRSKGQSAIAAAAYRSGEKLTDEATGQVKHYPARNDRIRFTGIFAPAGAPSWIFDRNRLWNAAEQAERRKDAALAREVVLALPHELTDQQRQWLVTDFVREAFVRHGLVADVAIHAPDRHSDSRNFHAHILVTQRAVRVEKDASHHMLYGQFRQAAEFPSNMLAGKGRSRPVASPFEAKKDRDLNSKETLYRWRSHWAQLCNRHLSRHGHASRIDHRTLAEQRVDREPTRHLGRVDAQRMRRGVSTVRGDGLKATRVRNALRAVTSAAREIAGMGQGAHGGARAATVAVEWGGAAGGISVPPILSPAVSDPPMLEEGTFERAGREIGGAGRAGASPERHAADAGDASSPSEPGGAEAEITERYALAIDAARKSGKPRVEIEAAIRALREQMRGEICAVRERRKTQCTFSSKRKYDTIYVDMVL